MQVLVRNLNRRHGRGIFLPSAGHIGIDVRNFFQGAAEMNRVIVGACVVLALTAGVGAQDKMATQKMDHMDHMAMEKVYSGCLESSQTGFYTLTHSMIADAKNSMKKADTTKKNDGMKNGDSMAHDTMAPAALALSAAAPSVNLSKHV